MAITKADATIEELSRVPGKAEIVNGELVLMSPTGGLPNFAAYSARSVSVTPLAREHAPHA